MIDLRSWKWCIWGAKLHTHTNSYVNYGFYKALDYLGAQVYWLDDNDINLPDLSKNVVFITEHQVDERIPISKDNFYILHNVADEEKYRNVPTLRTQSYTDDCLKYKSEKLDDCVYFSLEGRGLHYIWATDLLPHEIKIPSELGVLKGNTVNWVGTAGGAGTPFGNEDQLAPFEQACIENGINCTRQGIWADGNSRSVSMEEGAELIRNSYMAPVILGKWQRNHSYIPCRLFKNISYGQNVITNSFRIAELVGRGTVWGLDTYQLFFDAKKAFEDKERAYQNLVEQMTWVREKHTYVNRVELLMNCANRILEGK